MRRRDFLAGCGAAACGMALPGCAAQTPGLPPGELSGSDFILGHRLIHGSFPPPDEIIPVPVLIVGAGIAGLSAAWRFCREGFTDFALLELEREAGGNARSGENAISRYPLAGAHYLPLPNREARAVRAMLADLGALHGDPSAETPEYDERYLCHAPQERLYRLGAWQEGLLPRLGVPKAELEQQGRFFARMESYRAARDRQGRRVFTLPVAYGGDASEWAALDRLTLRDWLLAEGFDAPSLHWYANYVCRDDYGTDYRQISAWAGVHYFACRTGQGLDAGDAVLTAPEGNGWLVHGLRDKIAAAGEKLLRTNQAVYALSQDRRGCQADVWDAAQNRSLRYRAEQVIWAAPLFLLPHLARDLPAELAATLATIEYAPWMVANLSLQAPPAHGAGYPLAWDNVLQDSPSLGYVVATHQKIRLTPGPTVLTYYHPLSETAPAAARKTLLRNTRKIWAERILADLSHAHRDIRALTTRLDVFRNAHAMARPLPGFRDSVRQGRLAAGWERVRFAHADVSGLSLVEEANYWGVLAAEELLAARHGGTLRERLV